MRSEGDAQSAASVEPRQGRALDEILDVAASRGGPDDHGLANGGAPEVEGGELNALGGGEPVDHDHQAACVHNWDVDLLALVDSIFSAHAQHLLQLRGERSGTLELLDERAVERRRAR